MSGVVAALNRYPVKGLGPDSLAAVALRCRRPLPDDRRWAVGRRTAGEQPTSQPWVPKGAFAQWHNTPALAALGIRYDSATTRVRLTAPDGGLAEGRLDTPAEHGALIDFLQAHMGTIAQGPLRIVEAMDDRDGRLAFTDTHEPLVSILGLESVRALAQAIAAPIDPARFRANLWVDGLPAWHEFDWDGRTLRIGTAALRVVAPITRCAAIEAGASGYRDVPLLTSLERAFGHQECGVYAQVVEAGNIRVGQAIEVLHG